MKRLNIIGAVAIFAGLSLPAQATILAPGGSDVASPQIPGPAPLKELITPYSFGDLRGTVTSWVVRDPANPLGGLSFYYQINNTGGKEICALTIPDFGQSTGAPVDVETIATTYHGSHSGGDAPSVATRTGGAGSEVWFDFLRANELTGGQHSEILVVNSAYQSFSIVTGSLIDFDSFNVNLLGPAISAVPEPSTLIAGSLLLIPFVATTLRIVRKYKPKITRNSTPAIKI